MCDECFACILCASPGPPQWPEEIVGYSETGVTNVCEPLVGSGNRTLGVYKGSKRSSLLDSLSSSLYSFSHSLVPAFHLNHRFLLPHQAFLPWLPGPALVVTGFQVTESYQRGLKQPRRLLWGLTQACLKVQR